jgi:hypothetical protein
MSQVSDWQLRRGHSEEAQVPTRLRGHGNCPSSTPFGRRALPTG